MLKSRTCSVKPNLDCLPLPDFRAILTLFQVVFFSKSTREGSSSTETSSPSDAASKIKRRKSTRVWYRSTSRKMGSFQWRCSFSKRPRRCRSLHKWARMNCLELITRTCHSCKRVRCLIKWWRSSTFCPKEVSIIWKSKMMPFQCRYSLKSANMQPETSLKQALGLRKVYLR